MSEFVFGEDRREPPPRPEPVARCRGATREYHVGGGRWIGRPRSTPAVIALREVSLSVRPGEVVGLAGPSGSGKSTLLHLLAALDVPTSGTIELAGEDVGALSERERTRLRLEHVGVVFQRFHLLPSLSARANVALPLIEAGVRRAERRARAEDRLEEVGLGDRASHRPGELSGGERQRVAIARALVTDPDLLLADEPTGEVDTATGERILSLIADAADDRAVLVASHDRRALAAMDRVVRLRDGRRVDGRDGDGGGGQGA